MLLVAGASVIHDQNPDNGRDEGGRGDRYNTRVYVNITRILQSLNHYIISGIFPPFIRHLYSKLNQMFYIT